MLFVLLAALFGWLALGSSASLWTVVVAAGLALVKRQTLRAKSRRLRGTDPPARSCPGDD